MIKISQMIYVLSLAHIVESVAKCNIKLIFTINYTPIDRTRRDLSNDVSFINDTYCGVRCGTSRTANRSMKYPKKPCFIGFWKTAGLNSFIDHDVTDTIR